MPVIRTSLHSAEHMRSGHSGQRRSRPLSRSRNAQLETPAPDAAQNNVRAPWRTSSSVSANVSGTMNVMIDTKEQTSVPDRQGRVTTRAYRAGEQLYRALSRLARPIDRVVEAVFQLGERRIAARAELPPHPRALRALRILEMCYRPEPRPVTDDYSRPTYPYQGDPTPLGWTLERRLDDAAVESRRHRATWRWEVRSWSGFLQLAGFMLLCASPFAASYTGPGEAVPAFAASFVVLQVLAVGIRRVLENDERAERMVPPVDQALTFLGGCGGLPAWVSVILDEPYDSLFRNFDDHEATPIRDVIGWDAWLAAQDLDEATREVFTALAPDFDGSLDTLVTTARALAA